MSATLSKNRVLVGLQCSKRLYLETHCQEFLHGTSSGPDPLQRVNGAEVGEMARRLRPSGRLVSAEQGLSAAITETERLMADHDGPLFEATFSYDGVVVRADVIDDGWLIEVKSTTNVKTDPPQHLEDAAVQAWVIESGGYPLQGIAVEHVDNSFVLEEPGCYEGLLHTEDVTQAVRARTTEVPKWIGQLREVLADPTIPDVAVGAHCTHPYECPFMGLCWPAPSAYPVTSLPHGGAVVAALQEEGFQDLREVPRGRLSKDKHIRVHESVLTGRPYLDPVLGEELRQLPFPRAYLDFETIMFAVPRWPGMRPYQQAPFQWSLHIEHDDGRLDHREFLDLSGDCPIRPLTETLVDAVPNTGPVVVYNKGFESTVLQLLANLVPDLADQLRSIRARLYDLLPLFREHYYHPDMHGSWSLKKVLPTLGTDVDYTALGHEVAGGTDAQAAYLEAVVGGGVQPNRLAQLDHALREYCRLDTLAMVRMVEIVGGKR